MQHQAFDQIPNIYAGIHTPENCQGHIIYVHGGPGSHSAYFEEALKTFPDYQSFPYGWITYDQRHCGRSKVLKNAVSHQDNLDDLDALLKKAQASGYNVKAILGHSYGARLAFDYCEQNPENVDHLILVGRAENPTCAYKRSMLMDILLLKIMQPKTYQELLPKLQAAEKPDWETRRLIRRGMDSDDGRKFFYWGNLETLGWFEAIKDIIGMPDNNDVLNSVIHSFPAMDKQYAPDPKKIKQNLLWINGMHDFLMGGDEYFGETHEYIQFFKGSGHYPQYEEPKLFLETISQFLNH